jgi:hypothetical protein
VRRRVVVKMFVGRHSAVRSGGHVVVIVRVCGEPGKAQDPEPAVVGESVESC